MAVGSGDPMQVPCARESYDRFLVRQKPPLRSKRLLHHGVAVETIKRTSVPTPPVHARPHPVYQEIEQAVWVGFSSESLTQARTDAINFILLSSARRSPQRRGAPSDVRAEFFGRASSSCK